MGKLDKREASYLGKINVCIMDFISGLVMSLCLIKHHTIKAYGDCRYCSLHSYSWCGVEVSGQVHAWPLQGKKLGIDWIGDLVACPPLPNLRVCISAIGEQNVILNDQIYLVRIWNCSPFQIMKELCVIKFIFSLLLSSSPSWSSVSSSWSSSSSSSWIHSSLVGFQSLGHWPSTSYSLLC